MAIRVLWLAVCVKNVAARHTSGIASTRTYYKHAGHIGPVAEQYNASEHFDCRSKTLDTCTNLSAARCDAVGWCRSFAIMTSHPNTVQMYRADFNESLYPHPKWTLFSQSNDPPPPPAPSPPGPPHPAPSPHPATAPIDYCRVKAVAMKFAENILAGRDLLSVFHALRLGADCNITVPAPAPAHAPAISAPPPASITVYADASHGQDTNDGSEANPVKTIARALVITRAAATAATASGGSTGSAPDPTAPVRKAIVLRAGTFYLPAPLVLRPPLDDHLTLASFPGETATLSGGVPLRDLAFRKPTAADGPLPGDPGGLHVRVATVTGVCTASLPDFTTLFIGGRRAVRARWPNANPETHGLHTLPAGYAPASAGTVGGHVKQRCVPTPESSNCPFSVPNFTYGKFGGGNDTTAGYSPRFEPYWCGKWSGITTFSPSAAAVATLLGAAASDSSGGSGNNGGSSSDSGGGIGGIGGSGGGGGSSGAIGPGGAGGPGGSNLADWNATEIGRGRGVLHMTRGSSDIWANFQWPLTNLTRKGAGAGALFELGLGPGGWQFPRGESGMGWWFVDNVKAELDTPGEWYFDPETRQLYLWPNSTGADDGGGAGPNAIHDPNPNPNANDTDIVATRLTTLVRVAGAAGVRLSNLTFAHTEVTYLRPYETPSGGGYSVHRGAMVEFRDVGGEISGANGGASSGSNDSGGGSGNRGGGTGTPTPGGRVDGCVFDSPGGNGLLVEGQSVGVIVARNEFKWVGDSAIVVLGRTRGGGCDARGEKGFVPDGTLIEENIIREVGVWGKQGCGFFQALAMRSKLSRNAIFNGPRAGVLWNDGLGGGNVMENNLLFNLVRETTDHGPFNSWDRVPFITDKTDGSGGAQVGPAWNHITKNYIICNYECTWPIDHDDGSNHYNDTFNALFFGGSKNYLGHTKRSEHNIYVYPDAKPREGRGGQGKHMNSCANNDGAKRGSSGWGEVYANNRCVLRGSTNGRTGATTASPYAYDRCDDKDLNGTVDISFNNTFYCGNAPAAAALSVSCNGHQIPLKEYQSRGYDVGSVVLPVPTTDEIFNWVTEMLGFKA